MFHHLAAINFDTEFAVPPDCLQDGEVDCRVIQAGCAIRDVCDGWATFEVCFLLKITIRCGERICSFLKERHFTETVGVDCDTVIQGCQVTAAVCQCVICRGKVHCNLTAKVEIILKRKCHCGCSHGCTCKKHHDWDGRCDWSGHVFHGQKFHDFTDHDFDKKKFHDWSDCDRRKKDCDFSDRDFDRKKFRDFSDRDFDRKKFRDFSDGDFDRKKFHDFSDRDFDRKKFRDFSDRDFDKKKFRDFSDRDFDKEKFHDFSDRDFDKKKFRDFSDRDFDKKKFHDWSDHDRRKKDCDFSDSDRDWSGKWDFHKDHCRKKRKKDKTCQEAIVHRCPPHRNKVILCD